MERVITFKSPQEFTQAAFNRVAELVSQNGQCALDNFVPAFSTEQCLEHLAFVASEMAYDYSLIGKRPLNTPYEFIL